MATTNLDAAKLALDATERLHSALARIIILEKEVEELKVKVEVLMTVTLPKSKQKSLKRKEPSSADKPADKEGAL